MYSAAIIEHAAKDVGEAIFFFGAVAGIAAYGAVHFVIHIIRKASRRTQKES